MRAGDKNAGGFAYVMVLFALAIFGIGLATLGTTWSDQVRRDKEAELIRIGGLYAEAIARYRASSPGSLKIYPKRLEELLEDRRFVGIERHLRQLYADPITGKSDWGLIDAPDGGIRGVYSLSDRTPLKQVTLTAGRLRLEAAQRYSDWKFALSEQDVPK